MPLSEKLDRGLGDQRLMVAQSETEKTWIMEQWYGGKVPRPTRILAALVLAQDVFTRLATQQMVTTADAGYVYKSFVDIEEARAHLLTWPQ